MPPDKPIACTLSATELPDRLAEIRAIGAAHLRSAEVAGSEAVLRFRADPGARGRIEAIVAAESRCCAFLDFDLQHGPAGPVLTIRAPAGGEPVLGQLGEAFADSVGP